MTHRFDPKDIGLLHDQARRHAQELRRQAISDLMSDLGHALDRAADHAARAARRWAHRLTRHQRLRRAASTPPVES